MSSSNGNLYDTSDEESFDDKYVLRDAGYASYYRDLEEYESDDISCISTISSSSFISNHDKISSSVCSTLKLKC